MTDFTHLSDEELMSRYNSLKQKQAEPESPVFKSRDYSTMSDEELRKAYEAARPKAPVVAESPVEAPTEQKKTGQDWRGDIAAGLRGVRAGIPFARDAATVIESLRKGVPFQEESKRQQERDRALQEEHPKSYFGGEIAGTFMPLGAPAKVLSLGKVAAGPSLASLATKFEGGLASKLGRVPFAKTIAAGTTGAGIGAIQGAGEGEDFKDRIENAISGGKWGAGLGAALPILGKAVPGLGGLGRADVEKAAEELRQSVKKVKPDYDISIPSGIASDFGPTRAAANFVAGLPFTKQIYDKGIQKGLGQLSEAVENIPGLNKTGLGSYEGGKSAKQSLIDWVKTQSNKEMSEKYNPLDIAFKPHANKPVDLSGLKTAANEIDTRLAKMGPSVGKSSATALVKDALEGNVPGGGIDYRTAIDLKHLIGEMAGDISAVPATDKSQLLKLYGALSNDLKQHFEKHGGKETRKIYEDALSEAETIYKQKTALQGVLGGAGFKAAPERIFKDLVDYGMTTGKENKDLLKLARKVIPENEWNNLKSAAVERMGYSPEGFNIQAFIKNYGRMTNEGKNAIFGEVGNETRNALENINTIAKRYKEVGKTQNFVNKWLALTSVIGLGSYALGGQEGLSKEAGVLATTPFLAYLLTKPRAMAKIYKVLNDTKEMPSPELLKSLADEVKKYTPEFARKVQPPTEQEIRTGVGSQVRRALTPKGAVTYAPVTADDREGRASGGRLGKGDYPAKRLSRMEKAVIRAQKAIAAETKPIMDQPDHVVARALEIAMNK